MGKTILINANLDYPLIMESGIKTTFRRVLEEMLINPDLVYTTRMDDSGKLLMFHAFFDHEYGYDPDLAQAMKDVPKNEIENMVKLAKVRNLRRQAQEIEDSINPNLQGKNH